ncbi:KleE stable inheritance protein [Hahella ganghwensis]|uniref:KleE stable inheritance protein n=1 Tax=Hahella ganghwensis TaxID=286420 RepID=UPI0003696C3D|nr:KleE stable inheritance protein [Hahella ganghwensis]
MTKIYKFPNGGPVNPVPPSGVAPEENRESAPSSKSSKPFLILWRWVWVALVLVWPVLKWIISIDVFFQGIRAIYHWNTPGINAGWTFLLHFAILTALTYIVSIHKPKGI